MLSSRTWDATGILLVRKSGGLVYNLDGSEHDLRSRCTLASLPGLKRAAQRRAEKHLIAA